MDVALETGMELRSLLARVSVGLVGTAASLALFALAARADEVDIPAVPGTGVVVHDADETLARWCSVDTNGTRWLRLPGGGTFELLGSPLDGGFANVGDGVFHPFDAAEVRAALAGVRFPLARVPVEIFVLPFPRRDAVESAAGPGVVFLAPGVRPIPVEQQHATVVHEVGHVVQRALMPDDDAEAWSRYRALRGIKDTARYAAAAPHADRPHEIFAEDFRALFGGALAVASGTIENAALAPPESVPGLAEFLASLAGPPAPVRLAAWPNPGRGAVLFARAGDGAGPVDVFDVSGRRIATLAPRPAAHGWTWGWDGRDLDGRDLASGVLIARERGGRASVRLTRTH
jgi:hypothetical protein